MKAVCFLLINLWRWAQESRSAILIRAMVIGPTKLYGTPLTSPDIRAGIALLTAALCADGETRISNAHQIDRGFFEIEKKLASVGAHIERIACAD